MHAPPCFGKMGAGQGGAGDQGWLTTMDLRRATHRLSLALACALVWLAGCGDSRPETPFLTGEPQQLGDPIAGLTQAEFDAFRRGKDVFERRFKPSEGLGPFYNATSCASCHSTPVTGGSAKLYRNFYLARIGDPTQLGAQRDPFGLPSAVIPAYGPRGPHSTAKFSFEGGRWVIPHGEPDLHVAQRNAIPIFGVGLFEFVSDETIASNADPDDADGDGISGRMNFDGDFVGRLGVKAQANNIETFTRPPLLNQMGITSDPFLGSDGLVRGQQISGGNTVDVPNFDADDAPDPEISRQDLGDLIAFTKFLAPPRPRRFNAAATRGQALFESTGCARCHLPSLPSSRGPVHAFTDLLLHEMGPDLADEMAFGRPQDSTISDPTTHAEFRTQPLWGVSLHAPFLHDGRAETLREAITMHGGEAEDIRDAFLLLTPSEQADVVAFLERL
jgi:CxxC motif-containing protein (DUF1111 family)